jgi:hypothetical protein
VYSLHFSRKRAFEILTWRLFLCQRQRRDVFFFTIPSRSAVGPTQILMQWVPRDFTPGVKRPGRKADHSPRSSVEVKNAWSYTSTPQIRLHDVVFSSAHGKFYLYHCYKGKVVHVLN